ncbi:hypothetical protein HYP07_gp093 [Vibrio phage JSF3]|uniref:hypothetical protein n=1 Tax=Vibrio phage JSF3 TaxID=1916111 RepID=UPI000B5FE1E0|nr:hypothetical protein HYP07_gp093 [Vibrio phage JSF3]APD18105.1 hypothetical protein [Vibrio phage JSF3]
MEFKVGDEVLNTSSLRIGRVIEVFTAHCLIQYRDEQRLVHKDNILPLSYLYR